MAANKKPRKKMNRTRIANPLRVAMIRAGKLTVDERELLIAPVKECFDRLRFGGFETDDFIHLADAMNVAHALTLPGIGLLPDHNDKFVATHKVLGEIAQRFKERKTWIARADELAAIETGIEFHEIQLQFASAGEMAEATRLVDRVKKGARDGNRSERYMHVDLMEVAA